MPPFDRRLRAGVCVAGAGVLVGSLFLTWSHQLPPVERARFDATALNGVPANPTAFQVYAIAGEMLALIGLLGAAAGLWGRRLLQASTLVLVLVGLAFCAHALTVAPTNGLLLAHGRSGYVRDPAVPGPGETLALGGLAVLATGLFWRVVRPVAPVRP